AARTPLVTSGVVGTFTLALTSWAALSSTASVCVPPTSTPIRRSGARGKSVLHRDVVEVVAKRARAGDLQAALAAPQRVARQRDHRDALAEAQHLGRDRLAALVVDQRDQVGNAAQHAPVLEGREVLVLDLDAQQAAGVVAGALDRDAAAHEAAGGA